MITLGPDPHPGSHTVVALDCNGCLLANITVPNTAEGLAQLHLFAGSLALVAGQLKVPVITSSRRS